MTTGSANDGQKDHPQPAPAPAGAAADAPIDFERAVEQVEAIIDRIESGEVGLEQSITEYERGVGLIRRCRQILDRAEQRVEELTARMQADAAAAAPPPDNRAASPARPASPPPASNTPDDDPESPF